MQIHFSSIDNNKQWMKIEFAFVFTSIPLFDVVVVHFVALLDIIFIIELVYTAGKQRERPA